MPLKTMNPFDLHDAALDWAVAHCLGLAVTIGKYYDTKVIYHAPFEGREFAPSRDWATGGKILQDAALNNPKFWELWKTHLPLSNRLILEHAMQCLVASAHENGLGVPQELL